VVVDERFYAMGGYNNDVRYLESVEVYSPVADKLSHAVDMPGRRSFVGITSHVGLVYAAGDAGGNYPDSSSMFDPRANARNTSENMGLSTHRDRVALAVI